jgi:nucleotide-binding universal stress UspA family protein
MARAASGEQLRYRISAKTGNIMRKCRRILVPIDGSPTSNKALVAALDIARDTGASIRLVHALDELAYVTGFEASGEVFKAARAGAERVIAEAVDIAKSAGVSPETVLVDKPGQRLGDSITEEATQWKADLIVLGTHGRRGFDRLMLGSDAEQIIRLAPTHVLVIRGDPEH